MDIVYTCSSCQYHDNNPFGRGGIESQIYGLSRAFVKKGHSPAIIGNFTGNWKEDDVDPMGIRFVNIGSRNYRDALIGEPVSGMVLSRKIMSKISEMHPDMTIFSQRYISYFPSKLKVPKFFVTHNPDAFEYYKNYSIKNNILNIPNYYMKHMVENTVIRNSTVIVALNRFIQNFLISKGYKNVSLVPNGVDCVKYQNSGDDGYILYAGGFRYVKGIDTLVNAYAGICSRIDENLILAGSGPMEAYLRKLVISRGIGDRVRFIPLQDKENFRKYLSRCSLFVLPSVYETFGMVVLEAMASGKLVISSNIPGPQDIITHGHDGILFEANNANDLATKLELSLRDKKLRTETGKNAMKTVEEKFTFDRIADSYLNIYRQIAN